MDSIMRLFLCLSVTQANTFSVSHRITKDFFYSKPIDTSSGRYASLAWKLLLWFITFMYPPDSLLNTHGSILLSLWAIPKRQIHNTKPCNLLWSSPESVVIQIVTEDYIIFARSDPKILWQWLPHYLDMRHTYVVQTINRVLVDPPKKLNLYHSTDT